MANSRDERIDPILEELIAVKRLLVFALLRSGASQKQVATALGVDQSQVSRMFPGGIGTTAKNVTKVG
jgi:predicted XRE-type DNA-binding protein